MIDGSGEESILYNVIHIMGKPDPHTIAGMYLVECVSVKAEQDNVAPKVKLNHND